MLLITGIWERRKENIPACPILHQATKLSFSCPVLAYPQRAHIEEMGTGLCWMNAFLPEVCRGKTAPGARTRAHFGGTAEDN